MSDKYLYSPRQQIVNAIGTESCWGWSPAIDFVELLERRAELTDTNAPPTALQPDQLNASACGTLASPSASQSDGALALPTAQPDESDIDVLLAELNLRKAKQKTLTNPRRAHTPSASCCCTGQDREEGVVQRETFEPSGDPDVTDIDADDSEVHILLAGACDIRHIFRTMASLRLRETAEPVCKHYSPDDQRAGVIGTSGTTGKTVPQKGSPRIVFYVYEPNLCLQGRQLFLLQWLWDSMFALEELEERVLMFLDVYGNACTRDATAAQIRRVVQHLLHGLQTKGEDSAILEATRCRPTTRSTVPQPSGKADVDVCGGESIRTIATKDSNDSTRDDALEASHMRPDFISTVSFDEMKLKERDFVEQQLAHWARDTSHADVEAQWSRRVRTELAERYDNRDNIIDWDYVFKLTDYTRFLRFPEYRAWRNGGVAFDVAHINPRRGFSYTYTAPNKTLCYFSRRGEGTYYGDVTCGPFAALGCTTKNTALHSCHPDGTCRYGCGIVAMHNVRAWLYALMTATPWPWCDHAFAWDDDTNYNVLPPRDVMPGRGTATVAATSACGSASAGNSAVLITTATPTETATYRQVAQPRRYYACFPKVRFHPITLQFDRLLRRVADGKVSRFDAAFFGTSCTHLMTSDFLSQAMSAHGVVVAETVKFVVAAEEAVKVAYVNKVEQLGAAAGWQRAAGLTAWLHEGQSRLEGAESTLCGERATNEERMMEAQRVAQTRYAMPFQIALIRGDDAAKQM